MGASKIVEYSRKLRDALASVCDPVHPDDDRISGVHHAIWCDLSVGSGTDGRSAVFYGDKAIDRSPGGTGTSARMAQLHGKGRLPVGSTYRNESLIGTIFEGRVESTARIGSFEGILPSIGGWARVIGHNTIYVDDRDPLAHGFQIS
jgi:proline racemase